MKSDIAGSAAEFATQAIISCAINNGLTAAINSLLMPGQLVLAVATSAATSAATYVIMATAKLAINGTYYIAKSTINGAHYLLFHPAPQIPAIEAPRDPKDLSNTRSAWDLADEPLPEDSP